MKVAVTGATGFIGSEVVRALQARGDTVVALSRNPDHARRTLPGTDTVAWPSPTGAFPEADAVVHLAGESVAGRWTPEKKAAITTSREEGTRRVVDAIGSASARPKVLVSASAVGYYGDRGDEELTEASAPGAGFLADVCRMWETEARRAEQAGIRVATPRIGVVLDQGGGALEPMLTPFRMGLGGPMGSGKQWFSWVHRADVVGLILHALDHEISGPMNATSPNPVRQKDFAAALGKALKRPAVLPTPGFAIRMLMGEFAGELLGGQKVLPKRALETGYTFRYPVLEAALAAALRG